MNKKIIAMIILVLVLTIGLAACNNNSYKQEALSGMELDAPVQNNGGLVVKQGKHIYFINSYIGNTAENSFGKQTISCLMRAELNEQGEVINQVVVSPKNVTSGIYIYDKWIYYTSPNMDKNKQGEANTTYLDIFRTSIDRAETQLLFTINNRSATVLFGNNCIFVNTSSNVYKIDLNKKNLNQIQDKDNYVSIMERVSSLQAINVDNAFGTYAFAIQSMTEEESSYRSFNTLLALDNSGNAIPVIGADSYDKEYKIAIKDYLAEGDSLTVYYTKTNSDNVVTLCAYKFDDISFKFDSSKEKTIMQNASSTYLSAVKGISFQEGALVTSSSAPYLKKVYASGNEIITEKISSSDLNRAISVKYIDGGYVYYTNSSDVKALYRFALNVEGEDNRIEEKVCDISVYTSFLQPELLDGYFYFIDGTSYSNGTYYLFRVKLGKTQEIQLVAKMTESDLETYNKSKETK